MSNGNKVVWNNKQNIQSTLGGLEKEEIEKTIWKKEKKGNREKFVPNPFLAHHIH